MVNSLQVSEKGHFLSVQPLPGREEILCRLVFGLDVWAEWWTGEKDEVNCRSLQTLFLKPLF